MGWLPAQPVEINVHDPHTGESKPASQQLINSIKQKDEDGHVVRQQSADPVSHEIAFKKFEVKTPAGSVVGWNEGNGWRESMSITAGRIGRSGVTIRYGINAAARSSGSIDGMRDATVY